MEGLNKSSKSMQHKVHSSSFESDRDVPPIFGSSASACINNRFDFSFDGPTFHNGTGQAKSSARPKSDKHAQFPLSEASK